MLTAHGGGATALGSAVPRPHVGPSSRAVAPPHATAVFSHRRESTSARPVAPCVPHRESSHFRWVCRRACDAVGFAHSGLLFIEPKRLVSLPGEGEQAVHWDCAYAYDTPPTTITFLLHCTEGDGIDTTALPFYSARERIPATRPRDTVALGSERMRTKASRRKQLQSAIPLLDKQHFHRVAARVGDVTLCRQSVPHYGTRNNSSGERVVQFAMLSSCDLRSQDDFQFSAGSSSLTRSATNRSNTSRRCQVAGKEVESMERFSDETSRRCAVRLLDKFGLLQLYYGEGGTLQWNSAQQQSEAEQRKRKKEKSRGAAGAAAAASNSASASASAAVSAPVAEATCK